MICVGIFAYNMVFQRTIQIYLFWWDHGYSFALSFCHLLIRDFFKVEKYTDICLTSWHRKTWWIQNSLPRDTDSFMIYIDWYDLPDKNVQSGHLYSIYNHRIKKEMYQKGTFERLPVKFCCGDFPGNCYFRKS